MIGPWSTLDEIIAHTVTLRQLQQEIRGEDVTYRVGEPESTPGYWTSYRYGQRKTRNRRRT